MKKVEFAFLLCGVCANVLYLSSNDLFRGWFLLLAVSAWLGASALHLAVHEIGHLAGGLISGYRLVFFTVGPVTVSYSRMKKLSIRMGKSHGGQCVMEPKKPESCRYIGYNLGGVIGNLVLTMAAAGLLLVDMHITALVAINLVCVGLQKILVNSIPEMVNGAPNDAFVLKLLRHNEHTQGDYGMYLKLFAAYYRDEEIDRNDYVYDRPLDVAENELLYYREIQAILEEVKKVAAI